MCAAQSLDVTVRIELRKRIPAAAGLGGASSDAAAVLLAIRRLHPTIPGATIYSAAPALGSDISFFLENRAALVSGRGDLLEPLPAFAPMWFVIATPALDIPQKTVTLYRALTPADFSDGRRIERAAQNPGFGRAVTNEDIGNAFQRPLYKDWPDAASRGTP